MLPAGSGAPSSRWMMSSPPVSGVPAWDRTPSQRGRTVTSTPLSALSCATGSTADVTPQSCAQSLFHHAENNRRISASFVATSELYAGEAKRLREAFEKNVPGIALSDEQVQRVIRDWRMPNPHDTDEDKAKRATMVRDLAKALAKEKKLTPNLPALDYIALFEEKVPKALMDYHLLQNDNHFGNAHMAIERLMAHTRPKTSATTYAEEQWGIFTRGTCTNQGRHMLRTSGALPIACERTNRRHMHDSASMSSQVAVLNCKKCPEGLHSAVTDNYTRSARGCDRQRHVELCTTFAFRFVSGQFTVPLQKGVACMCPSPEVEEGKAVFGAVQALFAGAPPATDASNIGRDIIGPTMLSRFKCKSIADFLAYRYDPSVLDTPHVMRNNLDGVSPLGCREGSPDNPSKVLQNMVNITELWKLAGTTAGYPLVLTGDCMVYTPMRDITQMMLALRYPDRYFCTFPSIGVERTPAVAQPATATTASTMNEDEQTGTTMDSVTASSAVPNSVTTTQAEGGSARITRGRKKEMEASKTSTSGANSTATSASSSSTLPLDEDIADSRAAKFKKGAGVALKLELAKKQQELLSLQHLEMWRGLGTLSVSKESIADIYTFFDLLGISRIDFTAELAIDLAQLVLHTEPMGTQALTLQNPYFRTAAPSADLCNAILHVFGARDKTPEEERASLAMKLVQGARNTAYAYVMRKQFLNSALALPDLSYIILIPEIWHAVKSLIEFFFVGKESKAKAKGPKASTTTTQQPKSQRAKGKRAKAKGKGKGPTTTTTTTTTTTASQQQMKVKSKGKGKRPKATAPKTQEQEPEAQKATTTTTTTTTSSTVTQEQTQQNQEEAESEDGDEDDEVKRDGMDCAPFASILLATNEKMNGKPAAASLLLKDKGFEYMFTEGRFTLEAYLAQRDALGDLYGERAKQALECLKNAANGREETEIPDLDLAILFALFDDLLPTAMGSLEIVAKGGDKNVEVALRDLATALFRTHKVKYAKCIIHFLLDIAHIRTHAPVVAKNVLGHLGALTGVFIEHVHGWLKQNEAPGQWQAEQLNSTLGSFHRIRNAHTFCAAFARPFPMNTGVASEDPAQSPSVNASTATTTTNPTLEPTLLQFEDDMEEEPGYCDTGSSSDEVDMDEDDDGENGEGFDDHHHDEEDATEESDGSYAGPGVAVKKASTWVSSYNCGFGNVQSAVQRAKIVVAVTALFADASKSTPKVTFSGKKVDITIHSRMFPTVPVTVLPGFFQVAVAIEDIRKSYNDVAQMNPVAPGERPKKYQGGRIYRKVNATTSSTSSSSSLSSAAPSSPTYSLEAIPATGDMAKNSFHGILRAYLDGHLPFQLDDMGLNLTAAQRAVNSGVVDGMP